MANVEQQYIDALINKVYVQISDYFIGKTLNELVNEHFIIRLNDPKQRKFKKFHQYYYSTLKKEKNFIDKEFFNDFRQAYSLRGMTSDYLDKFDKPKKKTEILQLINEDRLTELYQMFTEEKHFGSFFSKLVHTFNPLHYTQVDIPIKKFFRLEHESYFIAFIVISGAYKKWAIENSEFLHELKSEFIKSDNAGYMKKKESMINEMKILNLIFWSESNKHFNV